MRVGGRASATRTLHGREIKASTGMESHNDGFHDDTIENTSRRLAA
jgi:hypothetical protein